MKYVYCENCGVTEYIRDEMPANERNEHSPLPWKASLTKEELTPFKVLNEQCGYITCADERIFIVASVWGGDELLGNAELIVRRVNQGPKVDELLEMALTMVGILLDLEYKDTPDLIAEGARKAKQFLIFKESL